MFILYNIFAHSFKRSFCCWQFYIHISVKCGLRSVCEQDILFLAEAAIKVECEVLSQLYWSREERVHLFSAAYLRVLLQMLLKVAYSCRQHGHYNASKESPL